MIERLARPGPVLIVEDDNDIRDALCQTLRDEGYDVLTAPNGAAGLHVLKETSPALVLLDLMMPVMNGWQFRQAQLAIPTLAGIPVVVISADSNARRESDAMDVDGFLQKPIELDVLIQTVSCYCLPVSVPDTAHSLR